MKIKSLNKYIPVTLLVIFLLLGLYFRWTGIQKSLSFWNDEDHVALFARGWLLYGKPIFQNGNSTGSYQLLEYFVTALSFKILGINEISGRIPSVIAGTLLIAVVFYIAKKTLGIKQAVISSALVAFSQNQIAWSTQLRPYIWLELFMTSSIYFLYKYKINKKLIDKNLFLSILFTLIATFFHGVGLINLLIIGLVVTIKSFELKKYKILLIPVISAVFVVLFLSEFLHINVLESVFYLFQFKFDLLHYRIYLTHNYLWLILGSVIGSVSLFRKKKDLLTILLISVITIFLVAIFRLSPRYIRYSLPAFPLAYLLFSEGIVSILDRLVKKQILQYLLIILMFMILAKEGKIILYPRYYYSINQDTRENPILDYKLAFSKIRDLIHDKNNVIVMDAWNDRVPWYLPGQKYDFLYSGSLETTDNFFGENIVRNINEFETEKSNYKSGVVIVEDWQSLTSEELKNHIRITLKHEFDVQDLPYNTDDHWGISIYSWGL